MFLRNIVANYFMNRLETDHSWRETVRNLAVTNKDELNMNFHATLHQFDQRQTPSNLYKSSPDRYLALANQIYESNHELRFLINRPRKNSIQFDPNTPFTICGENKDRSEIINFFLSPDYWGDENSIYALANSDLRLNVIPIENNIEGTNTLLRIPIGIFSNSENNNWSKYLFLYNTGGHFELICFNIFKKNKLRKGKKKITETLFIFDRNNSNILPALYIILLLFGCKFVYEPAQTQDTFSLLPIQMHSISDAYNKINNANFTSIFETYFPPPRSIRENKESAALSYSLGSSSLQAPPLQLQAAELTSQPSLPLQLQAAELTSQPSVPLQLQAAESTSQLSAEPLIRRSARLKSNSLPTSESKSKSKSNKTAPKNKSVKKGGVRRRFSPYSYSSPYYSSLYNRPPYMANQMLRREPQTDTSKLAFDITIMLELYPGTNVTTEQLSTIKCDSRWESVRKAWADFIGKPYVIIPEYEKLEKMKKKMNNKTQRNNSYRSNQYQKNNSYKSYYNPYQRSNQSYYNSRNYGGSK
jgi:hypothetical protein